MACKFLRRDGYGFIDLFLLDYIKGMYPYRAWRSPAVSVFRWRQPMTMT